MTRERLLVIADMLEVRPIASTTAENEVCRAVRSLAAFELRALAEFRFVERIERLERIQRGEETA